jgi:hypothetical protein
MSIPLQTTTVTVMGRRPQAPVDPDLEGYEPDPLPLITLVTGLRASITLPSSRRQVASTDQTDVYVLRTDPFEINRYDIVIDESDGVEYEVSSAVPSKPVSWGLQHTIAYITLSKGLSSGGDLFESA